MPPCCFWLFAYARCRGKPCGNEVRLGPSCRLAPGWAQDGRFSCSSARRACCKFPCLIYRGAYIKFRIRPCGNRCRACPFSGTRSLWAAVSPCLLHAARAGCAGSSARTGHVGSSARHPPRLRLRSVACLLSCFSLAWLMPKIDNAKNLSDKMVTNLTDRDLDYIFRSVENGLSRTRAMDVREQLPLSEHMELLPRSGNSERRGSRKCLRFSVSTLARLIRLWRSWRAASPKSW